MTQILITTDTYDTHELFNEIKKKSDAYKTMQISRKKKAFIYSNRHSDHCFLKHTISISLILTQLHKARKYDGRDWSSIETCIASLITSHNIKKYTHYGCIVEYVEGIKKGSQIIPCMCIRSIWIPQPIHLD